RYSPISVIASTPATVSRPNSRSMAARSSLSIAKISFPLMAAGKLIPYGSRSVPGSLIATIICKLHVNPKILLTKHGNYFLQSVAISSAHSYQVSLDRSLHPFLRVLDQLDDFSCFFDRDSLLHGDTLPRGSAQRRLHSCVSQTFQRNSAFDKLLL